MTASPRVRSVVVGVASCAFVLAIGVAAFLRPGDDGGSTHQVDGCAVVSAPAPGVVTTCPDAALASADLSTADLRLARLRGADLHGADLSETVLYGADLRGADLSGADLRGADLHAADLRDADLRGARLSAADLSSARVDGADLADADLSGARLEGMSVRDTVLEPAALTLGSSDGRAVRASVRLDLPTGVTSPNCTDRSVTAPVGTTTVRCQLRTDARHGGRLEVPVRVVVTDQTR
ncbi:pentapeptide repeat-containing protein [Curtobacterium sp. PhB115]|uniref:pentapeptide repeat-containing protein n=1 Tax=Curtobacterium sp. PhB115 TaxID=2485173 RepID=UPI000FB24581|nr:pentapeptide repeat-containing protein [Curtobacterium sp. PhB115]ROP58558.1 pentapeptide repeat protein [Curtobacterium sp. PhB115]